MKIHMGAYRQPSLCGIAMKQFRDGTNNYTLREHRVTCPKCKKLMEAKK